jgi:hypothetical protein
MLMNGASPSELNEAYAAGNKKSINNTKPPNIKR